MNEEDAIFFTTWLRTTADQLEEDLKVRENFATLKRRADFLKKESKGQGTL